MKRVLRTAVPLLVLGVLAVCVSVAAAGGRATTCNSSTSLSGTINGDVSAGPGCDLSNVTQVKGDVKVNPGGSLTIAVGSSITITGDVQSKNATSIDIEAGTIQGAVEIDGTTAPGSNDQTFVGFGSVKKDIEIQHSAAFINVLSETVGGDVEVHDNRGHNSDGVGLVQVGQSTIHGDVDLHNNVLNGSDSNFLLVFNGTQANGSVDKDVEVHDNSVAGGSTNQMQIFFNSAKGDIDVHNNRAQGGDDNEIQTFQNDTRGDLEVHDNTASGGSTNVIDVSGNTVKKELDCHNNHPPATNAIAGSNTAGKKAKGECSGL
jgi:hypothetical protein